MDRQQAKYLIKLTNLLEVNVLKRRDYTINYAGKSNNITELCRHYIDQGEPLHYMVGVSHQRLTALINNEYYPIVLLDKAPVLCDSFTTTRGGVTLVRLFSCGNTTPFYMVYRDLLLEAGWGLPCSMDVKLDSISKIPSKLSIIFVEKQND